MILKNMGGSHFALVVMVVGGGGLVKFFSHCMGSFEKSVFLPPPPIDLNGTALIKNHFKLKFLDLMHNLG